MRSKLRLKAAMAAAVALTLSACGSTLQPTGQTVASGDGLGGAVQENSDGTAVAEDGLGDVALDTAPTGSTGGGGTAPATGARTPTAARTGTPGTGGSGGSSPGATATANPAAAAAAPPTGPLKIGVVGVDVTALFVVYGAQGNSGSIYDGFNRFLEYINKTGGIAGRQVEAVYETIDIAEDYNAAAQRACEKFTTDNKVDLVIPSGWNDVLLSCLQQKGIAAFDGTTWTNDRGTLDHPNWFTPFALPVDRYAVGLIESGIEQGFLKKGDKLGVLYEDCPWGGRVYNGPVKAAASKHGLTTVNATTKCVENLVNDIGPVTNQIQQAALRFNSSGATHVLTLSGGEGFFIGQFQNAAAQQQYHPKYFFTSNGFPYNNTHPDSSLQWQKSDLPNMLGLGHLPYIDVGLAARPADDTQAAAQAKCKEADPETGTQTATEDPARAQYTQGFYGLCDLFFLLRKVTEVNGGRFDIPNLTNGYRSVIGPSPSAALTGGRHALSGKRLEGVGFGQPVKFDAENHPVYFGTPRSVT